MRIKGGKMDRIYSSLSSSSSSRNVPNSFQCRIVDKENFKTIHHNVKEGKITLLGDRVRIDVYDGDDCDGESIIFVNKIKYHTFLFSFHSFLAKRKMFGKEWQIKHPQKRQACI